VPGFFTKIFNRRSPAGNAACGGWGGGNGRTDITPWTGVDLDGTLAVWGGHSTLDSIGRPVPAMLDYVRQMVAEGVRVKIFTARAGEPEQIPKIKRWLEKHGLAGLEITNLKDYYMVRLFDDRCVQVEPNTGRILSKII